MDIDYSKIIPPTISEIDFWLRLSNQKAHQEITIKNTYKLFPDYTMVLCNVIMFDKLWYN